MRVEFSEEADIDSLNLECFSNIIRRDLRRIPDQNCEGLLDCRSSNPTLACQLEEDIPCLRLQFSKDPLVERLVQRSSPGRNEDESDIQVICAVLQLEGPMWFVNVQNERLRFSMSFL
jgi:hypothetical protein